MAPNSHSRSSTFNPDIQKRREPTLIQRKSNGAWTARFRHAGRTKDKALGILTDVLEDEAPSNSSEFVFEGGQWIPRQVYEKFSMDYRLPYIRGTYNPWLEEAEDLLFAEVKEAFLKQYDENENTARSYRGVLKRLEDVLPHAHMRLSHVSAEHVTSLIESPTLKSSASRQSYYRQLRAFFNWTVEAGFLAERDNPITEIGKPKGRSQGRIFFLGPEAYELVLQAAETDYEEKLPSLGNQREIQWVRPVFDLAVSTGLRRAELAVLQWQDIFPEYGVVEMRPKTREKDGIDFMPKGKRARRIQLQPRAQATLELLHERGHTTGPKDFVLLSPTSTAGSVTQVNVEKASARWREYRQKVSGAADIPFHGLRHLFVTYLLILDYSPYLVQNWAGHTDIKVTMNYAQFANDVASRKLRGALQAKLIDFGFEPPVLRDRAA